MGRIEITTTDGICPSYVFRPAVGSGPWPAVLMYMDGVGIRPAMLDLGVRLSKSGYFVLLPDLFYRSGPYEAMDARTVFTDPEQRKRLVEKFSSLISNTKIMADTSAFLDYLAAEPDVKAGGIGVTGYCMGGRMAIAAAGTFPERIVAAAAFHPSALATEAPDSPHLLASKIKARLYIARASEDAGFPDDMKQRLEKSLTDGAVEHVIETYPAKHGWVLSDAAAYDAACSERHWRELLALFGETLVGVTRS